jgi:hypothetical protein
MKRSNQQDAKLWDSFQDPPEDDTATSSIESPWIDSSIKILKVFTYWFVFIVVASTSVLSKLSFLFMTSNVVENTRTRYCDIEREKNVIVKFISMIHCEEFFQFQRNVLKH